MFTVEFDFVNETINFDYLLSRPQEKANNQGIYSAECPKYDIFFGTVTIRELKHYGSKTLQTLEIILIKPIAMKMRS